MGEGARIVLLLAKTDLLAVVLALVREQTAALETMLLIAPPRFP